MVDEVRFLARLQRLGSALDRIRILLARPDGDLLADDEAVELLHHRLIMAAEIAIDLANHVISSEGLRAPGSYADAFVVLGEAGVIDAPLAVEMERFARQRNLLVHEYLDIVDARVLSDARNGLPGLARYMTAIAARVTR